jgi:hypothetical protein
MNLDLEASALITFCWGRSRATFLISSESLELVRDPRWSSVRDEGDLRFAALAAS